MMRQRKLTIRELLDALDGAGLIVTDHNALNEWLKWHWNANLDTILNYRSGERV